MGLNRRVAFMRGIRALLVLGFLGPSIAHAEVLSSSYFCTAEFVGGLAYSASGKRWEAMTFNPTEKFVFAIKAVGTRAEGGATIDELIVTVTKAGSNEASTCSSPDGGPHSTAAARAGVVQCSADFTDYTFNTRNNRFLSVYAIGFVNGKDDKEDTPNVTGGTCTKIN
jgi:hypothetical protein